MLGVRKALTILLLSLYTADNQMGVDAFCHGVPTSVQPQVLGKLSFSRPLRAAQVQRNSAKAVRMTVAEWRDNHEQHEGTIGALPFGIDDVLLPGETKQLHLYEARFLALFEQSIKDHGSCLAHMFFAAQQELAAIATMVEIIEWRRQDVGVFVRVRAVGRVAIEDIASVDPYFVVKAKEVHDEPGDDETVAALVGEVKGLRSECVELQRRLDKGKISLRTSDDFEWGHEKSEEMPQFKEDTAELLAMHQSILDEGSLTEPELVSFLALTGFDAISRLAAIDMMDTEKRLLVCKELLAEQKKLLQAKSALNALQLD